jgi:Protein of unknown function (DUF1203)
MTVALIAIDPDELAEVRATGRDRQGHAAEPFTDTEGGCQCRCCLRLSAAGDALLLVSHAPLRAGRPWREAGPVFVHADDCGGPDGRIPAWFDDAPRVLRGYDASGAMHYETNRVVEPGAGVAAALAEILADPAVAEVHVRNLLAQCFIARAVRAQG